MISSVSFCDKDFSFLFLEIYSVESRKSLDRGDGW